MKNRNYIMDNVTKGGTQQIHLSITALPSDHLLSCADSSQDIRLLCKQGCVNYGKKWSCPPYSKTFESILSEKHYIGGIVLIGFINLEDLKYIKNSYQQVRAANIILKSKLEKAAREIETQYNGYALLSGSCNLCKPCKKKLNLPCAKPNMRKYSLESTGVNVSQLTKKYCNHTLLWYKKGLPIKYTSVVTLVLIDSEITAHEIETLLYKLFEENHISPV